jgi:TolB-like protein/Tfp pilus assembly protein PilF
MSSDQSSVESQFNLKPRSGDAPKVYEFGDFRLDSSKLMLYDRGKEIDLAPKVVETLLALIEQRSEIVSKDEMMKRLWSDSFVDEGNLTQYIYLLRKTLGDGKDGRPMIETFRRRGYRFNGEVVVAYAKTKERDSESRVLGSDATLSIRFLAVLPFQNESADPNAEYLSDGITESIINRLVEASTLQVAARSTVFRYKGSSESPFEIGRDLSVDAVLTGRVLQVNERLIVRTELADVARGWQIWGEQYNRNPSDILELQETIAREISETLRLKLTASEEKRMTKRYTKSADAYHLYIKGRYYLNKRRTVTVEEAAEYFQQAIDVDPSYAMAYVGLADCYPLLSLYGALTPHEAYPKARAAAEKAVEIDGDLTEVYNSLGVIKLFYEWDWLGAERDFETAIRLNPGYPDVHQRYGMLLTATGEFLNADAQFDLACELDPLSLITLTLSGYPSYYSRQFEKAATRFRKVIASDGKYSMAHFRLGLALAQMGNYEGAVAELKKSNTLSNDRDSIAALGYVQGLAGDRDAARAVLNELERRQSDGFVSAYDRVLVNVGLGDHDAALSWLERAAEERSYWLIYINVDPVLDPLRQDPRFESTLAKVFRSR